MQQVDGREDTTAQATEASAACEGQQSTPLESETVAHVGEGLAVRPPQAAASSELRKAEWSGGRTRAKEGVDVRAAAWSWQTEEGVWREYDPAVCDMIEQAFQMGQKAVCASQQLVIVFHEMEQRLVEDSPPQHLVSTPGKSSATSANKSNSPSASKKQEAMAALGLATPSQPASTSAAQLARPVRRHASCGRAEVLVALRERNAELRDGWWRAQQEQQKLQQVAQAEWGSAARSHALRASCPSAAATRLHPAGVGKGGLSKSSQGLGIGDGGGLVGIGCCLEHDPLLGVVFISSVRPGGAAALSGKVAVGDVLVTVDGTAVLSLEDAAELLVGPDGSLVVLELLWRGKTACVAMVRQQTIVLPPRDDHPAPETGSEGIADAGVEADAPPQWRVSIGAEIDFVRGVPTLISMVEGGAAVSSQGLQVRGREYGGFSL